MWKKAVYHGFCGMGFIFFLASIMILFIDGPEYSMRFINPWRFHKITRVIDGDTVVLDNRERLRIKNCAMAEIETDMGKAARDLVHNKYSGRRIELVDEERMKDRWGRTLSRAVVDGEDICEELIKADLAKPWRWEK